MRGTAGAARTPSSMSTSSIDLPDTQDTAGDRRRRHLHPRRDRLIATLPRHQAEAVLLRVVVGLDAVTAGRVLGRRPGAVRVARPTAAYAASPSCSNAGRRDAVRDFDAGQREMTRYPYPPADETWPPALQRLVVAVRAPAQPGELAGEDAAAHSFRAMRYVTPPRRTLTRVLAVKVAAGTAVLVAGGYAVAAATGAVPGPSFVPGPVATTPGPGSPDPHGTVDERGPGGVPGADPTRRPAES